MPNGKIRIGRLSARLFFPITLGATFADLCDAAIRVPAAADYSKRDQSGTGCDVLRDDFGDMT
jgi:hypothetical protein